MPNQAARHGPLHGTVEGNNLPELEDQAFADAIAYFEEEESHLRVTLYDQVADTEYTDPAIAANGEIIRAPARKVTYRASYTAQRITDGRH